MGAAVRAGDHYSCKYGERPSRGDGDPSGLESFGFFKHDVGYYAVSQKDHDHCSK